MDVDLMWAALGTLISALGVGVAWRQLRMDADDHQVPIRQDMSPLDVQGMSVVPPTGRLPRRVRGRDQVLSELSDLLRRPRGRFVVLTGMGGVGKSTVAATLARRAQRKRFGTWRHVAVWWVSAADPSSLIAAMVTVARQLDAPVTDLQTIALDRPDAPDRLWALLESTRQRWLLVLDNADDPEIVARSRHAAAVGDGTGWVRPSRHGLVVVTSRDASTSTWGRHATVINLEPLDELDAAHVLLDWARGAGSEGEARDLARRLGRLPLALGLAGSYLDSEVALKASFPDYLRSLDSADTSRLLAGALTAGADPRSIVMRTWELSLDALTRRGVPQARVLLRLLACYAGSTPIPLDLMDPQRLLPLLSASCGATVATTESELEAGLLHLRRLRLIDASSPGPPGERTLAVHPVIADTNRAHLAADATRQAVDPASVRCTAVELVVEYLAGLDYDTPVDWSRYRQLAPHLLALFETAVADLDDERLAALVTTAACAAAAHDRAGALAAAHRLSCATLAVLSGLDEDDPACLLARHNFAWEIVVQGRPAEAEAIYEDVFTRRARVLGPDHPDTLNSRNELAWVTAIQGRPAAAEVMYQKVLRRREQVLGNEHPDTLLSRHELAWVIATRGRGDDAETILHTVIDARTRILGHDHPRTLQSHHELAWAIATQRRWNEAETVYGAVLTARNRILGVEHPETLMAGHELAWTIAMQGRHRAAIAGYESVLAARSRILGADHPDTLATKQALDRLRGGKTTPAHHIP